MADYDGSIRIGTKIDTQGFDEDGKKLEAKAKKLANDISGSSDVEIKIDASGAKKEIEEVFEDIEKEEKRIEELAKKAVEKAQSQQPKIAASEEPRYETISSQGYNQEAIKFIEDYEKETLKADEHLNQLRVDVEEYAKSLKELKSQGQFFGDEDYDRVYLAWKNATDAVKAYQAELNKKTESGQAKIAEQEAKAAEKREAAQRRIEEQAERNLQKENARIQREAENQAKLEAKEAERKAKEEARIAAIQAKEEARRAKEAAAIQAQEAEEQRLDQIRINAVASNDKIIEKVERIKQLEQEIADLKKAGITEGYQDYDDRIQELEKLKGEIQEYKNNLHDVPDKFSKMRDSAKKTFDAASEGAKKSTGLLSTFVSRMKGLALSLLIFNWISKGFNAMISGMKTGFSNFAGYSDSYARSIQNMKNAMSTLGNQFAAAFAPIVQMVIPWLNSLINALTTAMTYVAQFFAVLGGKSAFTKAKKVQDAYNKSLGGTAKAADKARGALAKFDDLDVLQKQDDAGGGGGGGAGEDFGDMFEEVPVESRFEEIAKKAKDVFSKIFEPFKQAWESQGKFVMDSWEYALKEIGLLAKSVGSDFLEVWNQPETVSMLENILIIVGDIGIAAGNLARNFRLAWDENDTGKRILETIRDIVSDIIKHIRNMADEFVKFTDELDFSPLLNSVLKLLESLEPLADNVGAGLEWFWTNVLLPMSGWVIEDAIPVFLDMLSAALDALNEIIEALKPLGQWLWDEFLEPFGKWTGEAIISAMETVNELFKKFGDWITEHKEEVLEFATIVGILTAAFIGVNGAIALVNGVLPLLLMGIKAVIGVLTGPAGIIFALASMVVATGHGKEMIENLQTVLQGLKDFVKGVFTLDWKLAWDGIKKIVEGAISVIRTLIESAADAIDKLLGRTHELKQNANGPIGQLSSGPHRLTGRSLSTTPFALLDETVSSASLPHLATGSVIRGGNPFMAILGDQPAGKVNIEAPADLIKDMARQGIREELKGMNLGNNMNPVISLNVNGEEFARLTLGDTLNEMARQGYDVSVLGVT